MTPICANPSALPPSSTKPTLGRGGVDAVSWPKPRVKITSIKRLMKAVLKMQNRMFGRKSLAGHPLLSTRIDLTETSSCKRPRPSPDRIGRRSRYREQCAFLITTAGRSKPIGGTRITDLLGHSNWQSRQLQRQRQEEAGSVQSPSEIRSGAVVQKKR